MITLKIDEIKIESTNNNRRPVLRKKTLRVHLQDLMQRFKRNEVSSMATVEKIMGMAIKQMTMVSDPKYKRSLDALAWHFKAQYQLDMPMEGKLHVLIIIDTFKDADNFKIICDALEVAGVIKNDRQIVYYTVAKNVVKLGTPEKIIVQIYNENDQYTQKELRFDTPLSSKISIIDGQPV